MVFRPAIIMIVFATTACVQTAKYPDTWERLPNMSGNTTCPAISGVYENNGTKTDGTNVSLAVWLSRATGRTGQEPGNMAQNRFVGQLYKVRTVELSLIQNSHLMIHARGDNFSVEWKISRNDRRFECMDGAVVIPTGGNESGDNVLAFSTGSIKLYPGSSHLMLNSSGSLAGIMLFVPVVAYQDNWARFPRSQ